MMLFRSMLETTNLASLLLSLSLLISFGPAQTEATCSHATIAEVACSDDLKGTFGTLCSLVKSAGLADILDDPHGHFTVFAPTNDAFEELLQDQSIANALQEKSFLRDVLLYHVISGHVLFKRHLQCTQLYEMANGRDTRHVCDDGHRFQRGAGNPNNDAPKIIHPNDVCVENGVIHTVSKVILPNLGGSQPSSTKSPTKPPTREPVPAPVPAPQPEPTNNCGTTITDVACNPDDNEFDFLCAALKFTQLDTVLDKPDETYTVFAPKNQAFINLLGDDVASQLPVLGVDAVRDLLLFHVVVGDEVFFDELKCDERLLMANWNETQTVCIEYYMNGEKNFWKAQTGPGNSDTDLPLITVQDVNACNGIVHVIEEVMLPNEP